MDVIELRGVRAYGKHGANPGERDRDQPFDADTIATFCHYVHFFADRGAAEQWAAEHDGTFVISLDEGIEIAGRVNAARFPTMRQDRSS